MGVALGGRAHAHQSRSAAYYAVPAPIGTAIADCPKLKTNQKKGYAMSTNLWNKTNTELIRQTRPSQWGNWSLNSAIRVGAVGFLHASSGDFTPIDVLPSVAPARSPFNSHWKLSSQNVSKTDASVNFTAAITDPTTGADVKVGTESTWSFGDSGSVSSSFLVVMQENLTNPGNQIGAQFAWLQNVAKQNGYAVGDVITQGFGVVTEVLWAESGVNIGALSSNSTFALTGSVKGMASMGDSIDAQAEFKGSYFSEKSSDTFDTHIWPASADVVAETNVAVAFVFTSFAGANKIVPVWVNPLSEFSIFFNNAHGGTYIVNVTVNYTLNGNSVGPLTAQVAGGQSTTISGIPLDAVNVIAQMSFEMVGPDLVLTQVWATPLTQIPTGAIQIDIFGVWANEPYIVVSSLAPAAS